MNSKYLYLTIDLATISVPLLASFYPKAPFYKKWKYLGISTLVTAIFFLAWDVLFTQLGIWGFNPKYLSGIYVANLPIEEILFFICIPYACVFTYFALNYLVEKDILFPHQEIISSILIVGLMLLGIHHINKAYTGTTFILLGAMVAVLLLVIRARFMGRFYLAFIVTLLPFFIVNGILTGSFIEGEVVWYNNEETLGFRLGTIPVEDVFYGMMMLLMNIWIFEWLPETRYFRAPVKKKVTGSLL